MFNGIFHFFLFPLSILKRRPHSLQNQLLELAASVSAAADKVRLHLRCMGNGGKDRILRQKRENSRRNNPTLPRGPDKYLHIFSDWSWDLFLSLCTFQDAERCQVVATLMLHMSASSSAHCIKNTFVCAT